MSALSFLKTAKLEELPASIVNTKKGSGRAKQWNPNPSLLAIRVWKDGSVFPSRALVDQYDLEYKNASVTKIPKELKEGQTEEDRVYLNHYYYVAGPGNGFDVIDSTLWGQFKAEGAMLFISPVSRNEAKVDLFASVGYALESTEQLDEEGNEQFHGTPKSTVLEQGANTFGKSTLLPMLQKIYNITLDDENEYVDLLVAEKVDVGDDELFNITETYSQEVALYPKTIIRGDDKGKADYQRREGSKVYALIPADILDVENPVEDSEEDKVSEE